MTSFAVLAFSFSFSIFSFSFSIIFLVLVFVDEFVIFSFFAIFVFVNENHTGDRLLKLRLPSLELRRLHLDLVYCYKMFFGLVKLNSDFFEFLVSPSRGHACKLYKYRCKSIRADFFACRVVNFCTARKHMKFATKPIGHYPAHLRSVATLPFEIKNSSAKILKIG